MPIGPLGAGVSISQIKRQLAAQGGLIQVSNAISSDPSDPANIEWTSGDRVVFGGPLYNLIKASLGFNTASMTAFMSAAAVR